MDFDFKNIAKRENTESVKWNKKYRKAFCGNENAYPFWVADMEFKAADSIIETAKRIAESGSYGYPHFSNLKQSFISFAEKRHNLNLRESQISITQGVLSSISIMIECYLNEGDGIIIPYPSYKPFVNIATLHKLQINPLFLEQEDDSFKINFKQLEELCKKSKLLLFCSPHNPTGVVFKKEDLQKVCQICNKHNVFVISDEIHCDLIYENQEHHSMIEIAKEENTPVMVAMAPSKTFNIAGEHFSLALFNEAKYKKMFDTLCSKLYISSTSYFSTALAKAAYDDGYPWLMQVIKELEKNARFIEKYCKENIPEIKPIHAKASFVCLWDCRDLLPYVEKDALKNKEIYDFKNAKEAGIMSLFFGQRANLVLNDGTWFGSNDYKGFVRFNFATNQEEIKKALEKIKKAVDNIKKWSN